MANAARGHVALKAGGRELTLACSTNAICELEDASGVTAAEFFSRVGVENPSVKDLRTLFWALLRQHHPEVSISEAGALIDEAGLAEVAAALFEAVEGAFPSKAGPQTPRGAKAKRRSRG